MLTEHKNMQRGISIIGLIVLLALVPLIVWGLDKIVSSDFTDGTATAITAVTDTLTPSQVTIGSSTASTVAATSTVAQSTQVVTAQIPTSQTSVSTAPASTSTSATPVATNTVILTDSGFSPAKITVAMGQSVTFINQSSGKMWVAANPFPTSSEYPEFNEKMGVESGGSWTFTFDQYGTWFYHNHYSPATGAKVVVSGK